jgi:D-alanyl-D-alanine carboxypeptidase
MGRQELTADHRTLRGRPSVVAGLLGALAVTVAIHPADARHATSHHATRESSHESSRGARESGPPYAAIVVDVNSGNVLHSANADELRHPASLTKIMTLYLLFERLEAGKLKLDSQLPVSQHASVQAPTKLGLRPDQTIAVEDAIGGLVTKSANDAAVVIAEAIGGEESDFAEMMTRKARALGMSRTVYRNASGLPNDEQVTTARDQATLGRAIQERFPRYYRYFSMSSFTYHGQSMRNHNHLLGQVQGMDGIKTGYTQASGFNLVTSVRRNNRHIVSVVLGGASAGARDARMRTLIEQYIVAAAPQSSTTAVAQATRDPQAAELRAAEARPTETRTTETRVAAFENASKYRADTRPSKPAPQQAAPQAPQATYSVASYGKPVTWPAPTAAPAAMVSGQPVAPALADAAPTAAVPASRPASSDPIQPIQVKTVKVKLPQVAALTPPPVTPVPEPVAAAEVPLDRGPPQAAAPQTAPAVKPAAPQRAAMPVSMPFREIAPVEAKHEASREPVREAVRETTPSPPSQISAPLSAPRQATANQAVSNPATPTPAVHSGWIIQIGAFDAERDARQRLSTAQAKAAEILGRASPFTEVVVKGDKTLYRARFAGLQKDEAEAACRQLKRNDIDCMTIKN